MKENNRIKEILSSSYNGLNPPLKTRWQIISRKDNEKWGKHKVLQLSDMLDFTYYKNHPIWEKNIDKLLNKEDYFIPNKDIIQIKEEISRISSFIYFF